MHASSAINQVCPTFSGHNDVKTDPLNGRAREPRDFLNTLILMNIVPANERFAFWGIAPGHTKMGGYGAVRRSIEIDIQGDLWTAVVVCIPLQDSAALGSRAVGLTPARAKTFFHLWPVILFVVSFSLAKHGSKEEKWSDPMKWRWITVVQPSPIRFQCTPIER